MDKILALNNVSIGYEKSLIKDFSASLTSSGLIAVMGENGSGKSTLIKTILGIIPTLSGDLIIQDKKASELDLKERANYISMVFSQLSGAEDLSVYSYIELGRTPYLSWSLKTSEDDHDKIEKVISQLSIDHLRDRKIAKLSDGEKQRVSIAKALVQDTPILILDEPTAHLDIRGKRMIFQLLKELSKSKLVLFISHELEYVAKYADTTWMIDGEKIVLCKSEEMLREKIECVFS